MSDKYKTFVARWDHAMCSTCGEEHDRPTPTASPAYCAVHQHTKWCDHNGGVMGATGWEAPAPGLDLDAVARAERAMTPGPWALDPTDDDIIAPNDAVKHPDGTAGNVVGYLYVAQDWNGVVALRNAAPALIAEVRRLRADSDAACAELERVHAELERSVDPGNAALVAERNALADTLARAVWPDRRAILSLPIVVGNAVDRLQRAAADLAASRAEVRELRAKLAEAKRLGMEACALANSYADDAREYGGDTAAADRIAAALEAL